MPMKRREAGLVDCEEVVVGWVLLPVAEGRGCEDVALRVGGILWAVSIVICFMLATFWLWLFLVGQTPF